MADSRVGTFFVLEQDPRLDGHRWFCHWNGKEAPGFDSVDEAVAWGLARSRGVVVRTAHVDFYLVGEAPREWDPGLPYRPWPPSDSERRQIDADYEAACELAAAEQLRQGEYETARGAANAVHACCIKVPESETDIWFEELDASGRHCGGMLRDTAQPLVFSLGTAVEVVSSLTGRSHDDPWVLAVCAALERERAWRAGRRESLEVSIGEGETFHVSAAVNRESIAQHGLDWRLMRHPGVAGSLEAEADGVFLGRSEFDAQFFLRMARVPSDVWAVDVTGRWLENDPNGWLIAPEPIPASALRLVVGDGFMPEDSRLRTSKLC